MRGTALLGALLLQHLAAAAQGSVLVYRVEESCYVAPPHPGEGTIYVTGRLHPSQVAALNEGLDRWCPETDTWHTAHQLPHHLPSLRDYLADYATRYEANVLKRVKRSDDRPSNRRANSHRRSGNRRRPNNRLRNNSRRRSNRRPHQTLTNARLSPGFATTRRRGPRFQHYRAFLSEAGGAPEEPVADEPATRSKEYNNEAYHDQLSQQHHQNEMSEVLNSYSLRVAPKQTKEAFVTDRRSHAAPEIINTVDNITSNNGKRHIISDDLLSLELQTLQLKEDVHEQTGNSNKFITIPDSIIKDGQVFYRHDATAEPHPNITPHEQLTDELVRDDSTYNHSNTSESLIFSQALGSSGNDGSFHAEAEGHGQDGETTHSVVEGGQYGASASASAIRFNQQALAHASIYPSSGSFRQNHNSPQQTSENSNLPLAFSPTDIEELMRRNGYTGFAMATVTARKKDNNNRPPLDLGEILPGYSSSTIQSPQVPIPAEPEDETDVMLDNIVERVYTPPHIQIDEGGLEGGAGDYHHESEVEQVATDQYEERDEDNKIDNLVGLATYSQGIPGYPPEIDLDYLDLYENFDRYNFNQPSYFPVDYDPLEGFEISQSIINNNEQTFPSSVNNLPTELQSGIHYPIVKGDVPSVHDRHMIVDNSLSSYFPLPLTAPIEGDTDDPRLLLHYGNAALMTNENKEKVSLNTHTNSLPTFPDYGNQILLLPLQTKFNLSETGNNSHDSANFDYVHLDTNSHIGDIRTQPAYNSRSEYDRSRQQAQVTAGRHSYPSNNLEELHKLGPNYDSSGIYYLNTGNNNDNIVASDNIDHKTNVNNLDAANAYNIQSDDLNSNGHAVHDIIPLSEQNADDYSSSGPYIDETGYDSSYENSSQSSSSQAVYTASHHYSYQQGSSERGTGSFVNTLLTHPAPGTQQPRPNSQEQIDTVSTQQPTSNLASHSPLPLESSRHQEPPSASQGVQMRRVLMPRTAGSMFTVPSANPNLSEIKIVMAEDPPRNSLQQRIGKILQPGEEIPGTHGLSIPPGFRGRMILSSFGIMSPQNSGGQHMSLSSSSSASSGGSGRSQASTTSSLRMGGRGSLAATSSSSAHGGQNNVIQNPNHRIYSYQQTFDMNPPVRNYQEPHQRHQYHESRPVQSSTPGMSSKSWSNWSTRSWRTTNGGDGHVSAQSAYDPPAQDCGYWSMQCLMVHSDSHQNELCKPTHIMLACCC